MNRKLHNTLSALTFSAAALVLGLMAATPKLQTTPGGMLVVAEATAPFAQAAGPAGVFAASTAVASLAGPAPTSTALSDAQELPRRKSGKTSRIRQSMAVPFFSFAPRG